MIEGVAHGAELEELEGPLAQSGALLPKYRRQACVQGDDDGDEDDDWRQHHDGNGGGGEVELALPPEVMTGRVRNGLSGRLGVLAEVGWRGRWMGLHLAPARGL